MTAPQKFFNTDHEDMIHDAQMDYYGKRLATCSSDRTIKIWDISSEPHKHLADLRGHEGPVWQVAWAHPKFGSLLASCSYDHKVIIWKEQSANNWQKVYEYTKHDSSVNSIQFAPYELGLCLATASSDGTISVLTYKESEDTWEDKRFEGHQVGVNSVSWAPAVAPGALLTQPSADKQQPQVAKRLVSGGCDNLVKVFVLGSDDGKWRLDEKLTGHSDWVRDVAWAPNIGLPFDTIASCSQDHTVIIWTRDDKGQWSKKVLPKFPAVVWRVSWSITGNILAVSTGDNKVTLWKEGLDGEWKCQSTMAEAGQAASGAGSVSPAPGAQ